MIFNITGQIWDEANDDAKNWLPSYIQTQWNDALKIVNNVQSVIENENLVQDVNIILYKGSWGINAGLTSPSDNKVEVDWLLEIGDRGGVLRHEFQHLIAYRNNMLEWGVFGHGHSDDPYIIKLKNELEFIYHGDIKLRHIINLTQNL